jgi:Aspartyl/Asparaginyl beta-hydroxylase
MTFVCAASKNLRLGLYLIQIAGVTSRLRDSPVCCGIKLPDEATADEGGGMDTITKPLEASRSVSSRISRPAQPSRPRATRRFLEAVLFGGDDDKTFFGSDTFPWVSKVEAEWMKIPRELETLMVRREKIPNFQDISEAQKSLTEGEHWKTFWFYLYGKKVDENCSHCPETVRVLQSIPDMKSAMFSILAPRKHIPEHRGMYRGVLRYHLGLIVPGPEGACRIRVGNDVRCWKEGKSLIFLDAHPHEAWNDCDSHPRCSL